MVINLLGKRELVVLLCVGLITLHAQYSVFAFSLVATGRLSSEVVTLPGHFLLFCAVCSVNSFSPVLSLRKSKRA